jgi:type I restriction enzyme, S subunit
MLGFSRYDSYKCSGMSWLDEVPAHWEVLPFKALFEMSQEKNGKNIVGEMLSVSGYRGIELKRYEFEEQKRTEENLVDYRVVRRGQLVVNTMWLNYTGLGVSDLEGHVSPAYRSYWISDRLHKRYTHYLMRSHRYVQGYTGQMQGIRPNSLQIKNTDFHKFPILVPPHSEQARIAAFLDEKTAEIDDAIAKKQRLIELLQEQKAILINRAVTQGLDPNVPLRDSSVAWIGQIPAHWEVKKAKYLFRQSRLPYGKDEEVVTAYRDGQVTRRSNRRTEGYTFAILEQGYQGVRKGQLVVNSMDAFAGAVGVSDSDGKCTGEYVVCDPVDQTEVEPMYYALLIREMALAGYIEVVCHAVRQRALRLRYNNLAELLLPVPPMNEQLQIIQLIEITSQGFVQLIAKLQEEINLIKEFKSVLMSQAVTGKIKV